MMYGGAPLLDPADMQANALERMLSAAGAKPLYHLSDASGLRISKRRPHTQSLGSVVQLDMQTKMQLQQPPQHMQKRAVALPSSTAPAAGQGGSKIPVTTPSNRSEAVRLSVLLDTLLKTDAGGWDEQCHVYDSTFAEAILQVANHCIERGALLQRIRKFFQIVMRSEREAREAARKAREEANAAKEREREQRERADKLEAELASMQLKLDALRASMVRLKMLRAIHGRKLLNAEAKITDLEAEIERLKALLAEMEENAALKVRFRWGRPQRCWSLAKQNARRGSATSESICWHNSLRR